MGRAVPIAGSAMAFLVGCSKPVDPPQTVSWYLAHPDVMTAKVAWCTDDMQREQAGDCQNALAASRRKQLGSMKDLPPIDWNKPDPKNR